MMTYCKPAITPILLGKDRCYQTQEPEEQWKSSQNTGEKGQTLKTVPKTIVHIYFAMLFYTNLDCVHIIVLRFVSTVVL